VPRKEALKKERKPQKKSLKKPRRNINN